MQSNRQSKWRKLLSCKKATSIIPYSEEKNEGKNDIICKSSIEYSQSEEKLEENKKVDNRRDSQSHLFNDNLLADVNIVNALNLYKLQVDALWLEELPLIIGAFKKSLIENQSNKSDICLKILDIGCGTGELLTRLIGENGVFEQMISSNIKLLIIGVELDRSVYEFCKKRLKNLKHKSNVESLIYNGNATKLPFDSNQFDLIFNRHMLHCLPKNDIQIVLNETYRVLKQNGIVHFLAEDIEMIYTSVDDDQISREQNNLWSEGIYGTGRILGVDLRIGRKLPVLLYKSGFIIQLIQYAIVDTHRCHRQLLVDLFELWRKMYNDIWIHNNIDFQYSKSFENFVKIVQEEHQYVCWTVPIIQATKNIRTIS
ncbi:unnamed protein product [Rotaria sp. Silwood1]|nr:unnamed protein product [Rotaria sp. Silwood1]